MTDKQGDILIGISRNMEKLLDSIDRSVAKRNEDRSKGMVGKGSYLSHGIDSLAMATNSFNVKKGDALADFTTRMISVINTVNPRKAEEFGKFGEDVKQAIDTMIDVVSPTKLVKLIVGAKVLLGGDEPLLKRIVSGISKVFEDVNPEKIKAGSEGIGLLGEGLTNLGKAMGVLGLVGLAAPIIAPGILLTWGVIKLFSFTGKNGENIEKGGKALKHLGAGLAVFSAGLASLMLVVTIVQPKGILIGIAVIASLALTFATIGLAHEHIIKGGKSIGWMGLGLIAFSASLAFYMAVILTATIENIVKGIAVIGLIGGAFATLGYLDNKGFIKNGAKSMEKMGIGLLFISGGLLAFGLSLKVLQTIFKNNLLEAGLIGGSILIGLGAAFAAVGSLDKYVAKGGAAMTTVGIALLSISGGILLYGLSLKILGEVFKGDFIVASIAAASILVGLGGAFALIGVGAVAIIPGAAAMISVGLSLLSISGGILVFGLAMKGLMSIFGDKLSDVGVIGRKILLGIGLAFFEIGLASPLILPGAAAGVVMGMSLLSLSLGLSVFGASIKNLYDKNLIDKEGKLKGVSILSQLMGEFADIVIKSVLALPGIAVTVAMGLSLASIASGLNDISGVLSKLNPKILVGKLFDKTDGIIYGLLVNFEDIGKRFGGGLLSFLGTDNVSMGIQAVRKFGDVLQELAGGIVAFADFENFPIRKPDPKNPSRLVYDTVNIFGDILPSLAANLPILLTSLANNFASIGTSFGGGNGWFGEDSPVQKGINAISGLGKVLSELAGGIVSFANFDKFPVQIPDKSGKLIWTSVNLYDAIPKIKTALVGDDYKVTGASEKSGILLSLANIFAKIGTVYPDGFFTDSKVKKGVDAVKGIGSELSNLANGILAFAEIKRGMPTYDKKGNVIGYMPFKIEDIRDTIDKVLRIIPDVFAKLDVSKIESSKKNADVVADMMKPVDKIAGFISKISFKRDQSELFTSLGSSIVAFANNLKGLNLSGDQVKMLDGLSKPLSKFSTMGDGLNTFASALSKTGIAFSTFAGGFNTFSSSLDNFDRFSNSMSGLITNAGKYQFDKFAVSMGTLKGSINAFSVEKLKLTDSMLRSMAIISKSPETLGYKITKTLEESFRELVKAIKELNKTPTTQTVPTTGEAITTKIQSATPGPVNYADILRRPNEPKATLNDVVDAITTMMTNLNNSLSGITTKLPTGINGGLLVTNNKNI